MELINRNYDYYTSVGQKYSVVMICFENVHSFLLILHMFLEEFFKHLIDQNSS